INKLPLGYEIAIPRKEFMNEKMNFAGKDSQNYYHKVTMGETMASIARKYGLSVRELRRANRDVRFPQVGDYLRIPGMKVPENKPVEVIVQDTVTPVPKEEVVYLEHPAGYLPVRNLEGSYNLAVMLPFYLDENMKRTEVDSSRIVKGKKVYKVINRPNDWVYPRSLGFVEMYEGILLAADTLRSLGLDVKLHVFDVAGDTTEVTKLISTGSLDNMDLIIGPVFSRNLALVATYAGSRGIPVVSPVQLSSNTILNDNPMLFMANPTTEVAERAIVRKVADYYNNNFVLIHSDSESDSADYARFKSEIINELASRIPFEDIKLKDFVFYSRSVFGNDSINRLENAFSGESSNFVIIASDDGPLMSESLTDVYALLRKYSINIFGYPGVRYLDNLDHKICFDLGLMVYSPYWIDYAKNDIQRFNTKFRQKFFTEPSEISYAWQGYDVAYYFLSGLAMHGKEFLAHPEIHNVDLLHTEYDFRRRATTDGFENQKLYLIRYSNNYDLELVSETDGDHLK
ncbi:MAG: LysM peptidoglycan-binding domain-containing protein, partial [Bacteroidota bacterium]|nr:LysM peptidoglycan-binding domain-containing protein [Bacteroidota bacterium]